MNTSYRADIDGLRAIAILSVVVFHAFPAWLPGGFVGVDIFFVISGFLITGLIHAQLASERFSYADFYARRIKRILPILCVVLASTFLFGWFVLHADAYGLLGKHMAATAAFVANFVYLGESGYFDVDASAKPLLHLWSLAIEEQFYVVWPILLVLSKKIPGMGDARLLKLLLALSSASLLYGIYLTRVEPGAAYYLPFARFWELSLGGMALLLSRLRPVSEPLGRKLAWGGIALLALSFALIDKNAGFPGYIALLPCLGTAALLLGAQGGGIVAQMLRHKTLVFLGLTSYSFYLWHWPALFFLHDLVGEPSAPQLLGALALSLGLAITGYFLVETPLRHARGRYVPAVLVLVLTLIGYAGFNAFQRNGLDFREVNGRLALADLLQGTERPDLEGERAQTQALRLNFEPDEAGRPALDTLVQRLRKDPAARERVKADSERINHLGLFCADALKTASGCGAANAAVGKPGGLVVMVVGDSHAANFLHSLKLAYPEVTFVDFIEGGCVPISRRYQKKDSRCGQAIHGALAHVSTQRVDLVMLASRWVGSFQEIEPDLAHYRQHVGKVVIVGPSLTFKKDVHRILSDYTGSGPFNDHVLRSFEARNLELNQSMQAFALAQGASYIDKIALFCPQGNCPLFAGEALFIYDKGHLTSTGATHLAERLLAQDPVTRVLQSQAAIVVR